MNSSLRFLVSSLAVILLGLPSINAQERISKSKLREEQRIISVHVREARKDLDRAKLDLNGGRNKTAEIVLNRTEVSLSKAGGLLEEHPVRIEKLKGLFVGEKDRVELRGGFEKLDVAYLDLEREYYTMIDELGGGLFRKARLDFLKRLEGFLPDLEELNPELAAKLKEALEKFRRAAEIGDEAGMRAAMAEIMGIVNSERDFLESNGFAVGDTKAIEEVSADNYEEIVAEFAPDRQAFYDDLIAKAMQIKDPAEREKALELIRDMIYAERNGNMSELAKIQQEVSALVSSVGASSTPPQTPVTTQVPVNTPPIQAPVTTPPVVTPPQDPPAVKNPDGSYALPPSATQLGKQFGLSSLQAGDNPPIVVPGYSNNRLTKEVVIIINFDPSTNDVNVRQEDEKIWSLSVTEDASKRSFNTTLFTVWKLFDGQSVASGVKISGWKAVSSDGAIINTSSDAEFSVEFEKAGTYKIIVSGTTDRGSSFEIGRDYTVSEELFLF